MAAADFVLAGGRLRMRITGEAAALKHARREYGRAEVAVSGQADVEVAFGGIRPSAAARGGHKTAGWRVDAGDPAAIPVRVRIETLGWPQGFARSLAQGYILEPVVSV